MLAIPCAFLDTHLHIFRNFIVSCYRIIDKIENRKRARDNPGIVSITY